VAAQLLRLFGVGDHLISSPARFQGGPMSFAAYTRILIASHFYGEKILAWQCSVCGTIFCRTLDETACDREITCQGYNRPEHIEREFRVHNCEFALARRQQDYLARRQQNSDEKKFVPFPNRGVTS
jgi:hypothetical protein